MTLQIMLPAMSGLTLAGLAIFCFIFAAYVFTPVGRFVVEYPVFLLSGKGSVGLLGIWAIRLASVAVVLATVVFVSIALVWIGSAVVSAFTYVTGISVPMP